MQALSGIVIPVGIFVALFGDVSAPIALLTFLPLVPMVCNLVFQAVGLRDFGKQYEVRIRLPHYVRLVVGAFPYMLVLTVAALRAAWREYSGRRNWELTRHVGAHLNSGASPTAHEGAGA